jgi:hypothetical protein
MLAQHAAVLPAIFWPFTARDLLLRGLPTQILSECSLQRRECVAVSLNVLKRNVPNVSNSLADRRTSTSSTAAADGALQHHQGASAAPGPRAGPPNPVISCIESPAGAGGGMAACRIRRDVVWPLQSGRPAGAGSPLPPGLPRAPQRGGACTNAAACAQPAGMPADVSLAARWQPWRGHALKSARAADEDEAPEPRKGFVKGGFDIASFPLSRIRNFSIIAHGGRPHGVKAEWNGVS